MALSANLLAGQVERCLKAGMTDHIGKPIDAERLLEVIGRVTSIEDEFEGASSAA